MSDRLARERLAAALGALALEGAALPDFDRRDVDEILGYDQRGLWA